MIRLQPTAIQLSESDVHHHLQRVMLRHDLVADLERLELDCSDEEEDGKRPLGSPFSLSDSCASSVVLDSGSDIIAEAASMCGRSSIDCRYQRSHQEDTPLPEAGSSRSMPQLDGASFLANPDLNVENVSAMLASPHDGSSRLSSMDAAPTTHVRALMRGQRAAGRKGDGSCASEPRTSDPLVHFSLVATDHLDPPAGLLDLGKRPTDMCPRYLVDFQDSQDKQGASLMQQTPLSHQAVARMGPMLRFAQGSSFDSSDLTAVCEADNRCSPTKGGRNGCDLVCDVHREEHRQVNAPNMAKAYMLYASSRRQPSLPAYLPSGYPPNTRCSSLSTDKTQILRSLSWLRSPHLQLSLETRLAMLDLALPRTSFSVSYFPTAYERTRIGKSPEAEDKKVVIGELTVSADGSDPDVGYPAGELNLGLTASIVTSSARIHGASRSSDAENTEPLRRSHASDEIPSIRLSQIRSEGSGADEEAASEDSDDVSTSSTPTRHGRRSRGQNYDDAPGVETPFPMARIEIVPETRIAYTVFPDWEHGARRPLVPDRLITSSPATPISRERQRRRSFPGTATPDRRGSTAPGLGSAPGPSRMDRSVPTGVSFRPDIDRNVFQRVLRESIAFQRRFRALLARLDHEDDGPEDFGLAEVSSRPMGDWYRR
ncbi:hypothetical protein VTN02DRAFT_6397 [Thermoascus thermophilus]